MYTLTAIDTVPNVESEEIVPQTKPDDASSPATEFDARDILDGKFDDTTVRQAVGAASATGELSYSSANF